MDTRTAGNTLFNWDQTEKKDRTKEVINRWTTPPEDKERLQTILNFMFPYIQKKSDIFETGKETEPPPVQSSTVFDPWGDTEERTPLIPDLSRLFQGMINATTHTRR